MGSPGARTLATTGSPIEVGSGTSVETPTLGRQGSISDLVDRTQALRLTSRIKHITRRDIVFLNRIVDSAFYRILRV